MAEYGEGIDFTLTSDWDLSARQYRIAIPKSGTSNTCLVASQTPEVNPSIGVVQNKPQSGEAARIRMLGVSKVIAGDTIETGNIFIANATAYAIKGNSGFVVGTALSDAASGGIFTALINPSMSGA